MFTIYTKENCSFCDASKDFLHRKKLPYKELEIFKDISIEMIREKFPGVKQAPIIVWNEEFIGGYAELIRRFN